MGTHRPPVVMPDMKRRRASTGERIATIMTLARRLPLTRQVLADQLADATPSLVMRLLRAQSDNRLDRELAAIGRTPLLVIDELGYVPIDEDGSRLLFQVVTNAYETQSIIYTTNIEFSGWGRIFGDPNMAAAIIDRTVHHGRMIRFEGESWRKTHALMQ